MTVEQINIKVLQVTNGCSNTDATVYRAKDANDAMQQEANVTLAFSFQVEQNNRQQRQVPYVPEPKDSPAVTTKSMPLIKQSILVSNDVSKQVKLKSNSRG